jgi:hypothetical protein
MMKMMRKKKYTMLMKNEVHKNKIDLLKKNYQLKMW